MNKGLIYIPPPEIPKDFTREFNNVVPKCPTGERWLRFVWGMDARNLNRNTRRYHDCINVPAKYVGMERWILEGWQPPTVYNREEWAKYEAEMGAFPEKGVWDFCAILEDSQGRFLNLGARALQMAREWRFWRGKGKAQSVEYILETLRRREQLQERNAIEREEAIKEEFVREYMAATPGTRLSWDLGASFEEAKKKEQSKIIIAH